MAAETTSLSAALSKTKKSRHEFVSLLLSFDSFREEERFRSWLRIRNQSNTARVSLFLLAIISFITQIFMSQVFGTFQKIAVMHQYSIIASSVLWTSLVIAIAAFPPKFATTLTILHRLLYAVNLIGIVFIAITETKAYVVSAEIMFTSLVTLLTPYTFKHLTPFYITAFFSQLIRNTVDGESIVITSLVSFGGLVIFIWEREYLLRRRWAAEQRLVPSILQAQRNASHDVRNALLEILAIVEMGSNAKGETIMNANNSSIPPPSSPDENNDSEDKGKGHNIRNVITNPTNAIVTKTSSPASSLPATTSTSLTPPSSPENERNKSLLSTDDTTVLRVRSAISSMTRRLETSLRDGRNVVMDELSRLTPEIQPCSFSQMVLVDYAMDPLVRVIVDKNFPSTVTTDSEWLRTCILNLVHNAKKHGPLNGTVDIHLIWVAETSSIRIEVIDEGQGLSPAKSRDIWRGKGGGLGILAVISYIEGLGGKCGNKGSTFFIEVTGGRTENLYKMNTWTLVFVSSKAEALFRREGHRLSTSIWGVVFAGTIAIIVASMYYGSVSEENEMLKGSDSFRKYILLNLAISSSFLCLLGQVYFTHRPTLQLWCRWLGMSGIGLLDLVIWVQVLVGYEYTTKYVCEMKYLPGCTLVEVSILFCGPILNIPIYLEFTVITFVVLLGRIFITLGPFVVGNSGNNRIERTLASGIHVIVVVVGYICVWKLEKARRLLYVSNFKKDDLKRSLNLMELSSKARVEEVQREASRNAAHRVSSCFNTLLTASLQMHKIACKSDKRKNGTVALCFDKIQEARDDFIALQQLVSHEHQEKIRASSDKNIMIENVNVVEDRNHIDVEHLIGRALSGNAVNFGENDSVESKVEIKVESKVETKREITEETKEDRKFIDMTFLDSTQGEKTTQKIKPTEINLLKDNQVEARLIKNRKKIPRVLVVDDNDFCCRFVAMQIREYLGGNEKCRVDGVGKSASHVLEYMLKEDTIEYDLVLMDMSMPGVSVDSPIDSPVDSPVGTPIDSSIDLGNNVEGTLEQAGIWVTRRYKLEKPKSTTKFVCLSGMGRDIGVISRCKDAGFSPPFALGKPFDWNEMKLLLENALE